MQQLRLPILWRPRNQGRARGARPSSRLRFWEVMRACMAAPDCRRYEADSEAMRRRGRGASLRRTAEGGCPHKCGRASAYNFLPHAARGSEPVDFLQGQRAEFAGRNIERERAVTNPFDLLHVMSHRFEHAANLPIPTLDQR